MAKYMFLFRGGNSMIDMTPNEKEEEMGKWDAWMGMLGKSGKLIDGLPLTNTGKVLSNKGNITTDGPYAEGKEIIGGFVAVQTENIDEALTLTKGCPILNADNGTVEVREVMIFK